MIIEFYIAIVLLGVALLFVANTKESFPLAYLGMFVFLVIGLVLFNSGVSVPTGVSINDSTTPIIVTQTYTVYTVQNNSVVNTFASIFLYGGLVMIMASSLLALNRGD